MIILKFLLSLNMALMFAMYLQTVFWWEQLPDFQTTPSSFCCSPGALRLFQPILCIKSLSVWNIWKGILLDIDWKNRKNRALTCGLWGAIHGQQKISHYAIKEEYIQKYVLWGVQRHKGCHAVQTRKGNRSFNSWICFALVLLLIAG